MGEKGQWFRVVVSAGKLEGSVSAPPGGDPKDTERLIFDRVRLRPEMWHPLRLTFAGDQLTVQVAGVAPQTRHPVIAQPKNGLSFLGFEGTIGLRRLEVVK